MKTSTSSSEVYQGSTKTKMPLATSSFAGHATSSNSFRPTTPASTRSRFGAQSSINPGKNSELRSPRAASSDRPSTFALHSEIPAQVGKENTDSGKAPFMFSDRLRDSGTEVGSSSDIAPISWKDYIPEISQEEVSVDSNLKNQSKSSYGLPRTDSAQSNGSLFNFHEYIHERSQEGSKQGKQSQVVDVQNQSDSLFSFSNYINHKDQFGDFHGRQQENSTPAFGTQSLGSDFNFQEFMSKITQEPNSTGGKNNNSPSFRSYTSSNNQFGESHETQVTSPIQSIGVQSFSSSFSFEDYLPKTNQELNADKLGVQAEKFSVQNLSGDGLSFGAGTEEQKTENLPFRDYINLKGKSDRSFEMTLTNSTEKLGTQTLGLGFNLEEYLPKITQNVNTIDLDEHVDIPQVEEKSKDLFRFGSAAEGAKIEAPKDTINFRDKFNEFKGMPPTNFTQSLHMESTLSGSKFDDYLPERKQELRSSIIGEQYGNVSVHSKGKDELVTFISANEGEKARFTPHEKGKLYSSTNSIGSSFSPPVGGFAFTSKYGGSEGLLKGSQRRYIKIKKKGAHKIPVKKIDEERRFNFKESSSFKPLYSSLTGQRTEGPSSFSGSKNSDKMPASISESHFGKKNMSKIGHLSFKTRNTPMQFGSPELLRSFSFPSKPHNGLRSEEVHEFSNTGIYVASRSSGMDNDGEKWHARGNEVYERGDMRLAEEFYTRGIKSLSSDETYNSRNQSLLHCYSNRAAVRMSLGQIREALSDCLAASKIDPTFPKVQLQTANCLVALGNLEEAIKQFNKCLESNNYEHLDPAILSEASSGLNKSHEMQESISLAEDLMKLDSDQVPKALDMISDALSISSHSDRLMEMKANAMLKLRRYEDAVQYCEQISDSDGKDYISKQWRLNIIAKSYFYLGKLDEALEVIKRNEQAAVDFEWYESDSSSSQTEDIDRCENKFPEPDMSFIAILRELARLKAAGNEAFHAGQYTEAVQHFSAAIACSTESWIFTAVCLCNRAATYQALGQIVDAIADCSLAIALDPTNTKAFSRRAALYDMIRDYNQAANDLRKLISILEKQQEENQTGKPSKTNISNVLNRARRRSLSVEESAKKRIPLNLYLILGAVESASVDDVKEAYEKAVLKHHPDEAIKSLPKNEKVDSDAMWIEVMERVRKDSDHLFEIIGEAYAVLSDTSKRAKYDLDEETRNTKKNRSAVSMPRKSAPRR